MTGSIRFAAVALSAAALVVAPSLAAASTSRSPAPRSAAAVRPATAPICGGSHIRKSTGGYWQCRFDDEFSGSSLNTSKWAVQVTATSGFHSGKECFVNSPNNVSVSGGHLNLTVRAEPAPFVCKAPVIPYSTQYTSGSVSTYGKFSQAYGRFEVRAKVPATTVAGLQESLWLWPVNSTKYGAWPRSGEIDFAEMYSLYPSRAVPTIHYAPAGTDPNATNFNCVLSATGGFHTYTVVWTPTQITVSYDGATCLVDSFKAAAPLVQSEPFDQPFIVALTQALGIGANAFVPGTTPLPATTQIDYVRVWS